MASEGSKYLKQLELEIISIQEQEEPKVRFTQIEEKIKKLEIAIKILLLNKELINFDDIDPVNSITEN